MSFVRVRSLLALLVLGLAAANAGAQTGPSPALHIERMRYDFGKVFEKERYEYRFVVENRGDGVLQIKNVHPACGCTVAEYDSFIEPGGKGEIFLYLDGHQVSGRFEKAATVLSNDPNLPSVQLTIAGEEVPYIEVVPAERVALVGEYGEKVVKEVKLWSNETDIDFRIESVASTLDDRMTVDFEQGKDGQWIVRLEKDPEMPAESANGMVTVRSNSAGMPEMIIQVQVIAKGTITKQPQMVNYGRVPFGLTGKDGAPVRRTVMLLKGSGDFEVLEVDIDSDRFETKVERIDTGKYQLNVTFTPPTKQAVRQKVEAVMLVRTDDPREPVIRIRLIARAR